jgi:FkbM family methyltransferase
MAFCGGKMTKVKEHVFAYGDVEFRILIDESETIISETIEKTGVWEANQLSLYPRLMDQDDVFIDVGANVGINSLFMAKVASGARVISIEASPENFDILLKNIDGSKIEAHCLAIADIDGSIPFFGSGTNAKIDGSATKSQSISVPARRLDTLVQELCVEKIGLLKVDVEGYTDLVLGGAGETLKKTNNIIVEFSIMDVMSRFNCDIAEVMRHFTDQLDIIGSHFRYFYYISRIDGLVLIESASELLDVLTMEHSVGDILASNNIQEHARPINLLARRVGQLLPENHSRILEHQRLSARITELEQNLERLRATVKRNEGEQKPAGIWEAWLKKKL